MNHNNFVEVIKLCNGFIRATSTDGDSLSIKEALYLKKPVLASDCVNRPDGCLLYQYNNNQELISGIHKLSISNKTNHNEVKNGAFELIKFYREHLKL